MDPKISTISSFILNLDFYLIIKTLISILLWYIQYLLPPSSTSSTSQRPDRLCASLFGRFIYSSHFNVVFENPNNRFRDFRNHRENRYSQAESPYTRPALLLRITRIDPTSSTSFTPTLPSMQTG